MPVSFQIVPSDMKTTMLNPKKPKFQLCQFVKLKLVKILKDGLKKSVSALLLYKLSKVESYMPISFK